VEVMLEAAQAEVVATPVAAVITKSKSRKALNL
jgi:hypothetical protein